MKLDVKVLNDFIRLDSIDKIEIEKDIDNEVYFNNNYLVLSRLKGCSINCKVYSSGNLLTTKVFKSDTSEATLNKDLFKLYRQAITWKNKVMQMAHEVQKEIE